MTDSTIEALIEQAEEYEATNSNHSHAFYDFVAGYLAGYAGKAGETV